MDMDVVELIMADHREVERLFEQLRSTPRTRPLLAPVMCALLTAHSRAEEAEVYPVARNEADIADLVAHSQEEHAEAERVMAELMGADPGSAGFDKTLKKLVDSVTHHIQEEESSVLPAMRERLPQQRRDELGRAFARSRATHLGERPGEATLEELRAQARNMGMDGVSGMSKKELAEKLGAPRPPSRREPSDAPSRARR